MRFHYRTLRQAILAVLRIYGPRSERKIRCYCRGLLPIGGLMISTVENELVLLEQSSLVKRDGWKWSALPSRLGIGEI